MIKAGAFDSNNKRLQTKNKLRKKFQQLLLQNYKFIIPIVY